jgi:diaminohydroxyphosphoribosylaminopyrimidine deaminase / 5-amino-6-(5-phosphoribosylamino)uracil reductase
MAAPPTQADLDLRAMRMAIAMAARGVGRTWPSPAVGCVIIKDGRVVGRGDTRAGGRPHAEFIALEQAGPAARGATLYTTLEPCAHVSERGPTCSVLIPEAGIARVVIGIIDPDPRTAGQGAERLRAAGIDVVVGVADAEVRRLMAGWLLRLKTGRPRVTLKLATSADGCIALGNGQSQWITGALARAHGHLLRSRHDAILVGRGTAEADDPSLDVRLPGLEDRSPLPVLMSRSWPRIPSHLKLADRARLANHDDPSSLLEWLGSEGITTLLIEGGSTIAGLFLAHDLVDEIAWYRAPVLLSGKPAVADLALADLASAHGRWVLSDNRRLGDDHLDVYIRTRKDV